MRSITRLFGACGTLAESLLALAGVIDTATAKLRIQLAGESDPPALAHAGEVLEHTEPDSSSTTTKRGRKAS